MHSTPRDDPHSKFELDYPCITTSAARSNIHAITRRNSVISHLASCYNVAISFGAIWIQSHHPKIFFGFVTDYVSVFTERIADQYNSTCRINISYPGIVHVSSSQTFLPDLSTGAIDFHDPGINIPVIP